MSIIDDALKKTQANLEKTKDKETPAPVNTPHPTGNNTPTPPNNGTPKPKTPSASGNPVRKPKPEKTQASSTKIVPILLILVCLGGALFFVLGKKLPQTWVITEKLPFSKSDAAKKRVPSIKPRTKPLPKINYDQGTLILNGTSLIDNNRVALINNKIYSVGETVNGKKILGISSKKVELETETGEIIQLKVGN